MEKYFEELALKTVLVHTTTGELREFTLRKVLRELGDHLGYKPSYHQLLNRYFNGLEIDFNYFDDSLRSDLKPKTKLNIPVIKRFYGRISESKHVFQSISKNMYKFIIITSIAGQGKTALLVNIASNIEGRSVFWASLNEWMRPVNLFNDLAYFLKENRKMSLYNYLGSTSHFNLQDALGMFIKDSMGLAPVLIIDDFHKANREVRKIFSLLKNIIDSENKSIFIISSREKPGFYNRRDLLVSKTIMEIDLEGLDKDNAYKILQDRNIPEAEFETAFEITKGHPLALELYTPSFISDIDHPNLEFNTFVGEEVVKDLADAELKVLKLASLLQRPASGIAFFFEPTITQEVLDGLEKKLILRTYPNNTYDIHDLIKSYFLGRMTDYEKQSFISIAIEFYSNASTENDILDYLRLISESAQKKRLISAVLEHGEFLLSQGYSQVGDYINDIKETEVSKIDSILLSILNSDLSMLMGNNSLARRHLKRGLEKCDRLFKIKIDNKKKQNVVQLISKIYDRSAELSKLEGRLDETIKAHKQSVNLNRKYKNKPGEGKALNNLAIAYRERGELTLALDTLKEAQKIFNQTGNQTALAMVEINIGDLYLLKKDIKKGMKHYENAKKLSYKYTPVKGLIYNRLGQAYMQIKQFRLAQDAFLESHSAYKEVNDLSNRIRNLNGLFSCSYKMKNKEGAKGYLDMASKLLLERFSEGKDIGLKSELQKDHYRNKLLYSSIWDKKLLKRDINEYVNFHLKYLEPRVTLEELDGLTKELKREKGAVLMLYTELETGFWKLDDKHPIVILSIYKANLLNELNKRKEAKSVLKKIYPEAKRLKFKKAVRSIKELSRS
jgi:tetratricopeptide (TPR) repeat protein